MHSRSLTRADVPATSQGGLDARYLISNIRPTLYHPKSLTTLCTPHRGSEFMAWCRANIGIGTEYEGNEALNLRPSISSSLDEPDDVSIPLPYSLKAPILSREQVLAAKKAAAEAKQNDAKADKPKKKESTLQLPGLPFNLSASVTGYLLDLLDSPAYANLAPAFLRDVFNPSTPDDPSVKYYSIAARATRSRSGTRCGSPSSSSTAPSRRASTRGARRRPSGAATTGSSASRARGGASSSARLTRATTGRCAARAGLARPRRARRRWSR